MWKNDAGLIALWQSKRATPTLVTDSKRVKRGAFFEFCSRPRADLCRK
jgi:hypothetical protein